MPSLFLWLLSHNNDVMEYIVHGSKNQNNRMNDMEYIVHGSKNQNNRMNDMEYIVHGSKNQNGIYCSWLQEPKWNILFTAPRIKMEYIVHGSKNQNDSKLKVRRHA